MTGKKNYRKERSGEYHNLKGGMIIEFIVTIINFSATCKDGIDVHSFVVKA